MSRARAVLRGAIGGAAGAACMTVLRMGARRAGLIDVTTPQATRQRMAAWLGRDADRPESRQLLDSLLHAGVGVTGGALHGALVGDDRRPGLLGGALFGLGVWAVGLGIVASQLGIARSPRRATRAETLVNVAAHVLYGTATALVAGELADQTHGHGAALRRWRGRTG